MNNFKFISMKKINALIEILSDTSCSIDFLENKFKVKLYTRGNLLSIKGNRDPVEKAYFIIEGLYKKLKNNDISAEEIESNIDLAKPTYIKEQIEQDQKFQINTKLKTIYPKTKNQEIFLKEMRSKDIVFAVGPAGTGKTYLAVAYAVSLFVEGKINRLILSRPAVEAGERLGFLPGDMKEKIDPYLRPLYDALYEMMPGEEIDRKMVNNLIEIAPLAFMRGRTLNKSFIILDEAQNTLSTQMKMFLTRLGQNSKMVITGDLSQKDLPDNAKSGMQDAMEKLEKVKDIGFVHLNSSDVCRHTLVEKIINAYDK